MRSLSSAWVEHSRTGGRPRRPTSQASRRSWTARHLVASPRFKPESRVREWSAMFCGYLDRLCSRRWKRTPLAMEWGAMARTPALPKAILLGPLSATIEASKAAVCYVRNTPTPAVRFAEGFRTPALCRRAVLDAGPAFESLVRRKPRGGRGAVWLGGTYGDLKVADGSHGPLRGCEAPRVIGGNEGDALFRGRGCERRAWARRSERVCGRCEGSARLLRRAAGSEAERRCEAGRIAIMKCRS